MSDGVAIAVDLLVGAWSPTKSLNIITDGGVKGDLMWKYDYVAIGSAGSSQSLSNALMHNSSKKCPYKNQKF